MNENALNMMSMLSLTSPSQPEGHPELVYRFGYSVLPIDQYTGVSGVTFFFFNSAHVNIMWKYQFRKEAVDM